MIFSQIDVTTLAPEIMTTMNNIVKSFGPMMGYTRLIFGFGATIWILTKVQSYMATGQSIANNLPTLAQPLFIMLLMILYNPLISFMNLALSPLTSGTDGWAKSEMAKSTQMKKQFEEDIANQFKLASNNGKKISDNQTGEEKDTSFLGITEAGDMIMGLIEWLNYHFSFSYLMNLFLSFIQWLLDVVLTFTYLGIIAVRSFNMAILIILGPLALALCVFSPFKDNWKQWIVNYVNKFLWLPVGNIALAVAYTLKNKSDAKAYEFLLNIAKTESAQRTLSIREYASGATDLYNYDYSALGMSIGVTALGIVMMFQVPAFVNLIVAQASGGATSIPTPGYHAVKAMGSVVTTPASAAAGFLTNRLSGGGGGNSPSAKLANIQSILNK